LKEIVIGVLYVAELRKKRNLRLTTKYP